MLITIGHVEASSDLKGAKHATKDSLNPSFSVLFKASQKSSI
ncbi:hypothetical protein VAE122_500002 [Vibrio aestuarianus]|nr:hypothetical protein VAE122_500002 [Vibrio aestuarianus]